MWILFMWMLMMRLLPMLWALPAERNSGLPVSQFLSNNGDASDTPQRMEALI